MSNEAITVALIMSAGPILATAIAAVLSSVMQSKIKHTAEEIHVIVNNQRTEMMREIDNLKAELAGLRSILAGKMSTPATMHETNWRD